MTLQRKASPSSQAAIDQQLGRLREGAKAFGRAPPSERLRLLSAVKRRFHELGPRFVELDCLAKGIPGQSVRSGECGFEGPAITLRYLAELERSVGGERTLDPAGIRVEGGKTKVQALPRDAWERVLFPGYSAEVWLDRVATAGDISLRPDDLRPARPEGEVALVLGAGNVASISALDVLQQCFIHGRACLLKVSPVNDYLGPLFELAFAPLAERGCFSIAYGGPDVGAYLAAHPNVDAIHVTGSYATHEMIVWGPPGPERDARKARREPLVKKPVTSELGNVSPAVVVPGSYADSDIDHAAKSIVGSFVFNAAFNCNATKLVVTPRGSALRERLLSAIQREFAAIAPRRAYYPGAQAAYEKFTRDRERTLEFGRPGDGELPWAFVQGLDPASDAAVFREEPFCSVLSEVALSGDDPVEFLREATRFLNERVFGTLNVMLLVPATSDRDSAAQKALERAIAELRYGSVCINVWPAVAYGLGTLPWGGHPSGTLENVGSGIGVGHNALLLDGVEKCVLRGPLAAFPKPLWYPDHKTLARVATAFCDFEADRGALRLGKLAMAAVRG
jgi:aldehyde dehydrogenase (NAD(P)+)